MRICVFLEDQIVSGTLSEFLFELGYEAITFDSGCNLLKELNSCALRGDLIITELNKNRRMDIQLVNDLHKKYPAVPIVLATDAGSILPSDKAISFGVYAYLRKPIILAELELLLSRLEGKGE